MAKQKREPLYYIAAAGLCLIAIFIDIYLINNGGAKVVDPEVLAHHFTGSIADWIGIILFNASLVGLALGFIGMWEAWEMPNSTRFNYIFFAVTVASIILIVA